VTGVETPEFLTARMDQFGGPDSFNHYAVGWAHAMDTPYQWTKQVASHWGGTRNGTIVHWPRGIKAKNEIRSQFCHVIDIAPTILEAAGIPEPTVVNSVQQSALEGTSMVYSFDGAKAPERHELQYFEMFCNRGIYYKGWSAVTRHSTPWVVEKLAAFDDDVWELYDGSKDWTQARNLAKEMPDKLRELQRLWLIEATKYNVLPMDDRTSERLVPEMAGRPTLIRGDSQLFFPGMGRLSENSVVSIKNKSFSVTAEVVVPDGGADGVIIAQGGRFGGWSVYAKNGKAKFVYNVLGIQEFTTESDVAIPAGTHQVRMEFAYDGGGLAKGGDVTLYFDGTPVGTGRVGATQPMIFSADETTDIGYESGTTVTSDYTARGSRFTGKINWVQIDLGNDDHDHFIDPEERLRVAMSRQ
jgi:arylsulfatase